MLRQTNSPRKFRSDRSPPALSSGRMRARASANYSGKFYESARTASTGADTRLLLFGGDSADTARGSQYPTPLRRSHAPASLAHPATEARRHGEFAAQVS